MYFLGGQNNRGKRSGDGKFQSRPRMGLPQRRPTSYRDWSYHLVEHKTGTAVSRTTYHVGIEDPHGNRIAFLRDYPSLQSATLAAQHWIDERLRMIDRIRGKTPQEPDPEVPVQEK